MHTYLHVRTNIYECVFTPTYMHSEVTTAFKLYLRAAEAGFEVAQANVAWILEQQRHRHAVEQALGSLKREGRDCGNAFALYWWRAAANQVSRQTHIHILRMRCTSTQAHVHTHSSTIHTHQMRRTHRYSHMYIADTYTSNEAYTQALTHVHSRQACTHTGGM
jgi:hypothetical protein